jgi:HlyD family secretion protein
MTVHELVRLVREAGPARVWVLRDGVPTPVQVTTGLDDDELTEVVKGDLKPGDKVIVGEVRSNSGSTRSGVPRPRL